jgi:phosphocarrier protein FPr
VAAAVSAGLGDPLEAVAAAARGGLAAKERQLGPEAGSSVAATEVAPPGTPELTTRLIIRNRLGLHARPAAKLVRTLGGYDAAIRLSVPAARRGPADARSLTAVGGLGVRCGDELLATAKGVQAAEALDALRRLAAEGFGEPHDLAAPQTSGPGAATAEEASPDAALPGATSTRAALAQEAPPEPPAEGAVLVGVPAAPGVALGPARVVHRRLVAPVAPAGRPEEEWRALEAALAAAAEDLRRCREELSGPPPNVPGRGKPEARVAVGGASGAGTEAGDEAAIFDAHLLLLEDPELLEPVRRDVFAGGRSAASAWSAAVSGAAAMWDALDDPYQRARAADVRDAGERVLRHLAGAQGDAACADSNTSCHPTAGTPVVIVADELTPADVAAAQPGKVAGMASARGGPTAHAVILARALGQPVVVGAGASLLSVPPGTPLLVDGDAGTVTVRPSADAAAIAQARRRAARRESDLAAARAHEEALTLDGRRVPVEANVSSLEEVRAAVAAGADGVGLLRTEFLFLGGGHLPDEDEQAAAYSAVAAALDGRPLTIRTLDAGADKPLPSLPMPAERNPFLGVRGLRLGLLHPEQLRCQLRAVLRTAAVYPLRVMFPMVADVDELRRAHDLLDEARASLRERGGFLPGDLEAGVMLEVPSAALLAEHLAPQAAFFSVGTNDLTQYALAAERGNAGVAALTDPLHPAVLRLIARACDAARAAGRPVAVCGEAAGDPAAVPLLLGLGVGELSMSAVRIAEAKQAVRRTDPAAARRLAERALAAGTAGEVRRLLAETSAGG